MRSGSLLVAVALCLGAQERAPLTVNFEDSAAHRWLEKKVLASRLLDDMETLDHWTAFTNGPQGVVDARVDFKIPRSNDVITQMTLTTDRFRDGRHSLRLRAPTKLDKPGPASGRGWGDAGVIRHFDGEDWRSYNRLSFWVYPDVPGMYVPTFNMQFYNDGVEKLPAPFAQEGEHTLVLRNHEWNHVVWEIGNLARDKVTQLEISYNMAGNEPEAADYISYDFDRLELERVEPEHIEGWNVWSGRICYSHAGYATGASKSAIASGLKADSFRVIDQSTGKAVLSKPVRTVKTHLGSFEVMDFSEVRRPGLYLLEAGATRTQPFEISDDNWHSSIRKALNFFYAERCGMAIPGVHGACHRDWQAVHGDKRIIINGGWHDAGDLTQGLGNTGEVTYGMLSLAERLHARGEDLELYERLIEEGRWGLEWILKTSFGDGYRCAGSVSSRRTNGILGDFDDVTATARNAPMDNFVAAAAEALAARVFKERDPRLADHARKMAEADWRFAIEGLASAKPSEQRWSGSFDSAGVVLEPISLGVLASVDLWRATGDQRYANKAVEMARTILDSQERKPTNWDVPLVGFFYASPAKDRIVHYCHRGREQGPVVALARLCDAFPNHPDWMKWYSAVTLYSEYLKTVAKYTEPYGVLPASVYKDDEYLEVPESRRDSFRKQVLNGVPLGAGRYLRLFPVWLDYRGHFGTILPQAQALADAAHLRGDLDAIEVAERQPEWIIGRNPFVESTMWGEGHDFAPLYTPSSGDMVGALPVGIQTRGDADVPYWPVQSTWTYKEVWVHPVGRWIWLMRDLAGPALVEGQAAGAVRFTDSYGQSTEVKPDPATGRFRARLPQGRYTVSSDGAQNTQVLLPTAKYEFDLRPGHAVAFELSKVTSGGDVTIRLSARGSGNHRFSVRSDNLALTDPVKTLTLRPGHAETLEWRARIDSSDTPWTAVVFPDDDLSARKELTSVR